MHLIVSNREGELIHVKELQPAGMKLVKPVALEKKDFILLPEGTQIKPLFGRVPMGYDPDLQKSVRLHDYRGERVFPVSASLPETALQNYRSAYTLELDAQRLEPANYTAVGAQNDDIYVSALELPAAAPKRLDLSVQSGLNRKEEILSHLQKSAEHIVGFHLTNELTDDLASSYNELLTQLQDNSSPERYYLECSAEDLAANPDWMKQFARIFLTTNSLQPQFYNSFHGRSEEAFNVFESQLQILAEASKAALAYQVFPGLTDHPLEMAALTKAIGDYKIDHVQIGNMPCDPDWYVEELALFRQHRQMLGMREWWTEFSSLDIQIHTALNYT